LYSNSDIHFTGDGYDFTLLGVRANDRQSEFGLTPFLNLEPLPFRKRIFVWATILMKNGASQELMTT